MVYLSINMVFITYLYIIGIAQGLLLSYNFLEKGRGYKQYNWLGALIFSATIMIAGSWIGYEKLQEKFNFLFLLASGVIFLMGPLLYFFVKSSNKEIVKDDFFIKKALHFLPAILFYILIIVLSGFYNEEIAEDTFKSSYQLSVNSANIILPLVKLLHLLIYTLLSIKLIVKIKAQKQRLLKLFIGGYLTAQVIIWSLLIIAIFYNSNIFKFTDLIIGVVLALSIFILGYISVRKSDILSKAINKVVKGEYKSTGLDKTESKNYFKMLNVFLKEKELFLDPELNLELLANKIGLSKHQLSQVINENSNYNFSGLINHYRVTKFKELLINPKFKDFTLLAIAFESGFNNKNSFNQAFKKKTGITPSQYRKQVLQSN